MRASVSVFQGMDEPHLVMADGRGHLDVGVEPFQLLNDGLLTLSCLLQPLQ